MSLGISDKDNPKPCTLSTLPIYVRGAVDKDKRPYDLTGATKIYATIKSDLSLPDASAEVNINSVDNAGQFVLTYAATGNLDVIFSTTNTNLTAGTPYHVDIKAIWADGNAVPIVEDVLIFQTPATKAVT
jgi:hypothetical protein